jgi:myotubularin-related protein 1/2
LTFIVDLNQQENIHQMRNSMKQLLRCIWKLDTTVSESWLVNLVATKWLDHIRAILLAAMRIVELMDTKKASVMVHCSDGWDRTAQMVISTKKKREIKSLN